jgi:RNA ligase (TIGR02306 family)
MMSSFTVDVVHLDDVHTHPNADRLELAAVGGYRCVVQKGVFNKGDLVAYIPEQSMVPPDLLEEMGLVGRLGGAGKDRVKAVKLRGELSQGLVLPAREGWSVGDDVAEALGITKYQPKIPQCLQGRVKPIGNCATLKYDINNIKKFNPFIDDELIVVTEKIHGTFGQIAVIYGEDVVTSKGLGGRGLTLEMDTANLYWLAAIKFDVLGAIRRELSEFDRVYVLGEVFPAQDLKYGFDPGDVQFRVFDINVDGRFMDSAELDVACSYLELDRVPTLYGGPYSKAVVAELTDGKTTFGEVHVREGVVVRTAEERTDYRGRRCQAKSVSGDYLTRKGGGDEVQ